MTRSLSVLTLAALLAACSPKTGDTPAREAAASAASSVKSSQLGTVEPTPGKQEFKAMWSGTGVPGQGTSLAAATSAVTAPQHAVLTAALTSMLALPASAPAADKLEHVHQLQVAATAYDNAQAAQGRPRDSKQVLEGQLANPQARSAYVELLATVYVKPQALPAAPAEK